MLVKEFDIADFNIGNDPKCIDFVNIFIKDYYKQRRKI